MNTLNPRVLLKVHITVSLFLALAVPRLGEAGTSGSHSAVPAETRKKLAKLQIPFIANQGQSDREMKFYARTFAGTVFVTETGKLVYSLPKLEGRKQTRGVVLKEELIGGKVTEVKGENQATTKLNYFKGNDRSKWQRNIPSYDVVGLGEVYEGIEVKLKAYGNNVEKLFYVKPGVKPGTIKIRLSGGEKLRVNDSGELEVETEEGTVRFSKPVAFQEDGGKKEFVEVAYVVQGNKYGFKVADHDQTRELVIDPILAATFLGGTDNFIDRVIGLALDSRGNAYVAGDTASSDFPGVGPGSADPTFAGGDAFVAKLNSDLSSILAATFLSGSNGAFVRGFALDGTGNVFISGEALSSDMPGVGPGSADNIPAGREIFVAKLNSALSSILAATFLGGSDDDFANVLVVDKVGNAYVGGATQSSDFPGVGPGSADSTLAQFAEPEDSEGFVAKLNSDLSSVLAATFLGGTSFSFVTGLAVDSAGNIYAAGGTGSADLPGVGPGSADSTFAGGEAFVAKLNSNLSSILAATLLGGSGGESSGALALDSTGNVYATGQTQSSNFPGIGAGSADSAFAGPDEGFVAKLNSNLSSILAATFLGGGNGNEGPSALALDSAGNVYAAGNTESPDFPGVGPGSADSTFRDGEVFVAKLNSGLSSILSATFLGGSRQEFTGSLALDSTRNVYVAGFTTSADFPGVGTGSADSTFAGTSEGFVAKLDANLSSGLQIINGKVGLVVQSTSFNPASVSGGPAGTFTVVAVLTNKSTQVIREPIKANVKTLTNGNILLSATEGDGGVTSKQAIDAGPDDTLIPNESATVQFRIGLANLSRFEFFVDVLGPVQ